MTGAAGFIAHHVIEALLRSGCGVAGIDNFDPFYDRKVKERNLADLGRVSKETGSSFDFSETDIRDFDFEIFGDAKFDGVIHLAAKWGFARRFRLPKII